MIDACYDPSIVEEDWFVIVKTVRLRSEPHEDQ